MVKRTKTKAAAPPQPNCKRITIFSHRSRKLDENTSLCFVFSVSGGPFWVQNSLKSKPKSVQREVWGGSGGGLGQLGDALGRRGKVLGSSGFDFEGFWSHFEGSWGHFFVCFLSVFFESVSGSIFYRFGKDFEWFFNDF